MSRIRHMDLFSGVGGFALAVRWLGHETVGFCEIDPWCRRVLDKHWPGVPKHDDITTLKGTEFGPVDLATAGFPCQPYSVAGQQRGNSDDRALWPELARVIDEARPRFVLGENVAGIVNMALDGVLADLEAIGYTAGAVVIPAGAVNALHRRDRVWIMAHAESQRTQGRHELASCDCAGAVPDPERGRQPRPGRDEHPCNPAAYRKWQASDAVHAGAAGNGTEVARALDAGPDGLSPRLVRSRWADGTWEVGLPRVVAHEHERKQKLQAAGNGIVPAVAYEILKVMIGEAT